MLKLEGVKPGVVHLICCVLTMVGVAVAFKWFRDEPIVMIMLVACPVGLWGKLGFEPAQAISDKLFANLKIEDVVRIKSNHPQSFTVQAVPPVVAAPADVTVNGVSMKAGDKILLDLNPAQPSAASKSETPTDKIPIQPLPTDRDA